MSTKVCSNHFAAGNRCDQCTTPYTHLLEIKKKKSSRKRKLFALTSPPPPKRARNIKRDGSDNMKRAFIVEQHGNHIYKVEEKNLASCYTPVIACNHCINLNLTIIDLKKKLHEKEKELKKTGLTNKQVFEWIINKIKEKIPKLQY